MTPLEAADILTATVGADDGRELDDARTVTIGGRRWRVVPGVHDGRILLHGAGGALRSCTVQQLEQMRGTI